MRQRATLKNVVLPVVLGILTLTFLYPLYYMLINSLKDRTAYFTNPFGLPAAPLQWENYATMISQFLGFEGKTVGLPVEHIIAQFGEGTRLGVASNSYVSAANARRLGWAPKGPSLAEWMRDLSSS